MTDFSPDDFDVDLLERKVIHKDSGIWFSFYEYTTEDDWRRSDSVTYHDIPSWKGDRMELAAAAKSAAIKEGMKARRPEKVS
jgi:hypothetical protein